MKNETQYNRAKNDGMANNYVKLSQKLLQDDRLSSTELGIMVRILSNCDTFVLNACHIQRTSKLTDTQFKKAWNRLKELGYLKNSRIQGGYSWTVNEESEEEEATVVNNIVEHIKEESANCGANSLSWKANKLDIQRVEALLNKWDGDLEGAINYLTNRINNTPKDKLSMAYILSKLEGYGRIE